MIAITGVTYTKKEILADADPLKISWDMHDKVMWAPFIGAMLLVAGIVLIVRYTKIGSRRS